MNTRVGQVLCARHSGKHYTGIDSFNLHTVLCTCARAKSLESCLTLCVGKNVKKKENKKRFGIVMPLSQHRYYQQGKLVIIFHLLRHSYI